MGTGCRYEVTVTGRPGQRVLAALPGFELLSVEHGHARLVGWVQDQAALQGMLVTLGDLGVDIEVVRRLDPPA